MLTYEKKCPPGLASKVSNLCSYTGPTLRKVLHFGLLSHCHLLTFLITLLLNLGVFFFFFQRNFMEQGSMSAVREDTSDMSIRCASRPHQLRASWCRMSTEFQWTHGVSSARCKVCSIYSWVSGGADSSVRWCFPFEAELASIADWRQWCSKKYEGTGHPVVFFLTCVTSLY